MYISVVIKTMLYEPHTLICKTVYDFIRPTYVLGGICKSAEVLSKVATTCRALESGRQEKCFATTSRGATDRLGKRTFRPPPPPRLITGGAWLPPNVRYGFHLHLPARSAGRQSSGPRWRCDMKSLSSESIAPPVRMVFFSIISVLFLFILRPQWPSPTTAIVRDHRRCADGCSGEIARS